MPYFIIWKDIKGQYRVTIKGGNNEIMFTSEGYVFKQSALNAIRVVVGISSSTRVIDKT